MKERAPTQMLRTRILHPVIALILALAIMLTPLASFSFAPERKEIVGFQNGKETNRHAPIVFVAHEQNKVSNDDKIIMKMKETDILSFFFHDDISSFKTPFFVAGI